MPGLDHFTKQSAFNAAGRMLFWMKRACGTCDIIWADQKILTLPRVKTFNVEGLFRRRVQGADAVV